MSVDREDFKTSDSFILPSCCENGQTGRRRAMSWKGAGLHTLFDFFDFACR